MKTAILISCFDWYETRLQPIRAILEEKGYSVKVFTSDYDHIKKEKIRNKIADCIYVPVKEYKKNVSVDRLVSHRLFAKNIYTKLEEEHPQLIYALIPPNSVAKECAKYKKKNMCTKLIFDIIDMWPESMPAQRFHNTLPFKYWKKLRDASLYEADHIFTECNLYQEKINESLRRKCSTLFLFKAENWKDSVLLEDKKAEEYKQGKKVLRLCYLGSINHIIDIEGISHVVRFLSNEYHVEVRVIGKGESKDAFLQTLKEAGAVVDYCGAIYDEQEKFELLKDCDYALNMMVDSVSVGLTIKSIDYMSYGLPLINNIKGDTWKLVNEQAIGINYCKGEDSELLNMIRQENKKSHHEIYKIFTKLFSREAFIESFKRGIESI